MMLRPQKMEIILLNCHPRQILMKKLSQLTPHYSKQRMKVLKIIRMASVLMDSFKPRCCPQSWMMRSTMAIAKRLPQIKLSLFQNRTCLGLTSKPQIMMTVRRSISSSTDQLSLIKRMANAVQPSKVCKVIVSSLINRTWFFLPTKYQWKKVMMGLKKEPVFKNLAMSSQLKKLDAINMIGNVLWKT